jgi:hypothetical protein
LLSHWHCRGPLLVIAAAVILGKRKRKDEPPKNPLRGGAKG